MTDEELAELYEHLKEAQRNIMRLKQVMIAYREEQSQWNLDAYNRHLEFDQLEKVRAMIYPRFVRHNYDAYIERRMGRD